MAGGGIRITLEGDEALIQRLLAMGERGHALFVEATEDCTDHVRNRAVEGIANGPKTGRVYTHEFWTRGTGVDRVLMRGRLRPGGPHQASARGEYPAADTGHLMQSIWAEVADRMQELVDLATDTGGIALDWSAWGEAEGQISGMVGAAAEYAVHLEYKDPYDGGRPFMRRALAESEDFIKERFRQLRGHIVNP